MATFSKKQMEYFKQATHRWNVKSGATRSGKTYMDYYVIPKRIRAVAGLDGHVVILGNTKGTLQRNVIEPMQNIWGTELVTDIRSNNTAQLFGERCYCLGADKVSQVDRIRGDSIKYCYGDEVVTWHEDVFNMLKSRLDKEYSCFDGTCNPETPTHWFKRFLESSADIYLQEYTIDDNPFLPRSFVDNLKKEYAGTVFYDRYVLGRWVPAEGAIYKIFSENKKDYFTDTPDFDFIQVGIDFGGNGSAHAFVACGLKNDCSKLTALCTERHDAQGKTPEDLYALIMRFLDRVKRDYGRIRMVYPDSAEQTLINGLRSRICVPVRNSLKKPIIDRIRGTVSLMGQGKFFYTKDCESLEKAFESAVYKADTLKDERLDDGTSDIDTLDAFEYSWERYLRHYVR